MGSITHGEEENNNSASQDSSMKINRTLRKRVLEWIPALLVYFLFINGYFFKDIPTPEISILIFQFLIIAAPVYILTILFTFTTKKAAVANKKYLSLAWVPAILFILGLLYWIFTSSDQLAGLGFFYMLPGALVVYGVSMLAIKSFYVLSGRNRKK